MFFRMLDYRRDARSNQPARKVRQTHLWAGSRQWCIASKQCSSSCSISVWQRGHNKAKMSIFRHAGSAWCLSPFENIGIVASVPRHGINAIRPSPFPANRDKCRAGERRFVYILFGIATMWAWARSAANPANLPI